MENREIKKELQNDFYPILPEVINIEQVAPNNSRQFKPGIVHKSFPSGFSIDLPSTSPSNDIISIRSQESFFKRHRNSIMILSTVVICLLIIFFIFWFGQRKANIKPGIKDRRFRPQREQKSPPVVEQKHVKESTTQVPSPEDTSEIPIEELIYLRNISQRKLPDISFIKSEEQRKEEQKESPDRDSGVVETVASTAAEELALPHNIDEKEPLNISAEAFTSGEYLPFNGDKTSTIKQDASGLSEIVPEKKIYVI